MSVNRTFVSAAVAASLLAAGCSLRSTPVASPASALSRSPQSSHADSHASILPKLYAVLTRTGVLVYKQAGTNQQPIKTLLTGYQPEGVSVAANGDLYVTNYTGANVSVFKRGGSKPYKTLKDMGWVPNNAVVDSDGTTYVCNYENSSPNPPGDIAVYAPGATSPTSTLPTPVSGDWVLTCALDANHNLFVGYSNLNTGGSNVAEYVGGTGSPQLLNLNLSFPGQMEFDSKGDLVVADEAQAKLLTFKLPGTNPIRTIASPAGAPLVGMTFNATWSHVYLADYTSGDIYEMTYPKGTLIDTIAPLNGATQLTTVAADPPAPL